MKKIIIITSIINLSILIVVFTAFSFFAPKPKIMVADFVILRDTIVAKTATTLIGKDKSNNSVEEDDIEAAITQFQTVLSAMAKKKNAIIIDKNAVIGGDLTDVTYDLQNLISDL